MRDKLDKLGIDIDDAVNGVALPIKTHQGVHTKEYYETLETASESWNTKEGAMKWLLQAQSNLVQFGRLQ